MLVLTEFENRVGRSELVRTSIMGEDVSENH